MATEAGLAWVVGDLDRVGVVSVSERRGRAGVGDALGDLDRWEL